MHRQLASGRISAPQPGVGSSPEAPHLNPLAETNRMVYGSRWWHVCSCQQREKKDSSPVWHPLGSGEGSLEPARGDESNGIRLEAVASL